MQTVDFRFFPLESGDVVLDLGCGEGRHVISAYIEGDVQSVGVDLSLHDLQTTRAKFEDFNEPDNTAKSFGLSSANALALPFDAEIFDAGLMIHVGMNIADIHVSQTTAKPNFPCTHQSFRRRGWPVKHFV